MSEWQSADNFSADSNAQRTVTTKQMLIIVFAAVIVVGMAILKLMLSMLIAVGVGISIYVMVLVWRLLITHVSLGQSTVTFSSQELAHISQSGCLPQITMMVPVRKEQQQVIQRQAKAFQEIVYPRNLLQILILVDDDDQSTLDFSQAYMPEWVTILAVPHAEPRTKPRVLNYGLQFATGEIVGVWDGEDSPEPVQLLKVASAFAKLPESVVCVQGRLVFYQAHVNLLTQWAAIAYHGNFSLFIPALAKLNLPVPLGGTSNFITIQALRDLGGWDSWNVTEDLDLGIRIARRGWHVRVIDSVTEEEANPALGNCIRQWSRWEKGKMQTWLVHMRHPVSLWRDLGPLGFCTFQLIVGIPILTLLMNPIFIGITTLYYANSLILFQDWYPPAGVVLSQTFDNFIQRLLPLPLLYAGSLCLLVGNAYFVWIAATGALYRKQFGFVPAAFLSMVHWLLLSLAAYRGLTQLITKQAHRWELTRHGLLDAVPVDASPAPAVDVRQITKDPTSWG